MSEKHTLYITERHAWCSGCGWEFRSRLICEVEEAADWHADLTRGRIKPGWGVGKVAERTRVATELSDPNGRIVGQLKRRAASGAGNTSGGSDLHQTTLEGGC